MSEYRITGDPSHVGDNSRFRRWCVLLDATARHLGHSKLETTRIYAKWSDRQLRETIGRW
jgi:hypothetical protein